MAEEMVAHLEMQAEANRARGMDAEEARYAALRQFGGVAQVQERCREQRGWGWIENLARDLRHGLRQLGRAPGTSALAVLSLAVGIGVNTSLFSVMDAAFLRPLPVKDPERLVRFESPRFSYSDYERVHGSLDSLSGVVATRRTNLLLHGRESTDLVAAEAVSGNFFEVLGVGAAAGRVFTARSADLAEPIAVISEAMWRRRFGGDPAVVGRSLVLNDRRVLVVGVAAAGFGGERRMPLTELWYPVVSQPNLRDDARPAFSLTGRLRDGVGPERMRAEAATVFARPEWQALVPAPAGRESVLLWTEDESRMDHGGRLVYFMGPVVGLVLLVACANVSGLLLGRHEQRRREIAVRLALGAGRGRVMSYLFAEGAWLAFFGAAAGLAVTALGVRLVLALLPPAFAPMAPDVRIDPRVLGLTCGLTALSTLALGLLPAWRSSRLDIVTNLKTVDSADRRARGRQALVVIQVAVAMLLLAVGALFVRGFAQGATRELGFSERNLLLGYVAAEGLKGESAGVRIDSIRRTVGALPGVEAVGFAHAVAGDYRKTRANLPGRSEDMATELAVDSVDFGFFSTVGVPLRRGRDFDAGDNAAGAPVVVVNEALARRFWPGEDPIGRSLVVERAGAAPCRVVGVVGDVSDLTERDPAATPACYLPWRQVPGDNPMLIVRTSRAPESFAAPVREALRRVDGVTSLFAIDTIEGRLRASLLPQWSGAWIGGALGILSFALSLSGLFGIVAYTVARRTREIGIRVALGATPTKTVWLVLRQGVTLAAVGVALGLPLAVAAGRMMRSLLYGISPLDPMALATATVLVLGVAVLASWLPARRAAKVDPMVALRTE